jgi:hypothetical protein
VTVPGGLDEQAMNPTETTRNTEFIFRRLGDSFQQFALDAWHAVPLPLLVLAAALVVAKVGHGRYARATRGPGKPTDAARWLWWGAFLSVAALLVWTLVAFYQSDKKQTEGGSTPLSALGTSNDAMWYAFVIGLFTLGCVFVVAMYVKDSKSVRWYWAVKLATLRIAVYAILCFCFLLPAKQTWERTEKRSRVVVVLDISPSMTRVSDEIDSRGRQAKTRIDTLLDFLTDDKNESKVHFIQKILEKNPVVVYTFGTRLDESSQVMNRDEPAWNRADWDAFVSYDFRPSMLKGLSADGQQKVRSATAPVTWGGPTLPPGQKKLEPVNWADWAAMWVGHAKSIEQANSKEQDESKRKTLVADLSREDDAILHENLKKLDRRVDVARTIAAGTNVPDSVTAAVNRESANMVQGIVVFSDGRSNLGSDSSYRELRDRATKEKIPVFTVAVGEERNTSSINISEIQADESAQPDQGFKVIVPVEGVNLAGKSVDVELDVFYLGNDDKGPDGKPKELSGLTPDYTFNSATNPKKGAYQITFAPGDPPAGQIEFEIDPVKLAADPRGAKLTEESKDTAIRKPVLKEGKWAVRARIPKHAEEVFADPEHVRDRKGIQVLQKKLRVLLIAAAPGREFQFLRTFLVREVQDNRATVTVLVQNDAGKEGKLTPNPTEEVLVRFPDALDLTNKALDPKEKQYNLNEYDLIVAFDPDWSEVTRQQAENLQTWVERQGGGLIFVADRINTYQLIRKGTEPDSPLRPILDILPVVPDDIIAVKIQTIARNPRRLYMNPIPGSDLLKIDDPPAPAKVDDKGGQSLNDPVAGWERFFTDRDKYVKDPDAKVEFFPKQGFYSCYPVKEVKPGAHVLAELAAVDDRLAPTLRPWLVTNNPSAAWRTCFMGSGEVYRMYAYDKEYYERYWGKLMKYMAAKRNVKASRGRVLASKEYISGTPIRIQAQILNTSSKPYAAEGAGSIDPKFSIYRVLPNSEKPELVEGSIPLVAKTGSSGFDGYYAGQITADAKKFPPGEAEYFAEVEVPDSNGEKLLGKFQIVKSDPELDNTKPNFAAMTTMASEIDPAFEQRVPKNVVDEFKRSSLPKEGGVQKLAFRLSDSELLKLIPECFKSDYQQFDNKGPVTDLWDKGIELPKQKTDGTFVERNIPNLLSGQTLSWVMLVVIGLLSWEWLTRKLLRLA